MTHAKLRTAFLLTTIILLVELVGGLLSHSLALLADAGHVLTDILALGLAWFAAVRAERPADARNTYGQHRIGILAALANAVTLILIVIWIAYEAVQRLRQPETVTPWIMLAAATVGVAVNLYIVLGLRAEGSENLNVRGAMLHAIGDIGASVGVIAGALVIMLTGWEYADPIISLGIAALVVKSAWDLLGEAIDILMESSPRDLDVTQLAQDVGGVHGVSAVHDLHIWSIAGGMRVLTATTGNEAIGILQSTSHVAIVLMDIMMPEMDGYQTMQEIRRDGKLRRLPIIALTAKAMKGDREKCVAAGASDYLAKPVNTEQLLAALRMWLHR
jgi:cobalt-zinc-cadmium efflux system protein